MASVKISKDIQQGKILVSFSYDPEFVAMVKTINIAINALKSYYGQILKKKFIYNIKRPRKYKKLPLVLSREEVLKILTSVNNLKHKAILMLIYSA